MTYTPYTFNNNNRILSRNFSPASSLQNKSETETAIWNEFHLKDIFLLKLNYLKPGK